MQTQSNKKLTPKISQAFDVALTWDPCPFPSERALFGSHPAFSSTWEMVLCFPVSLCLQIPELWCIMTIGTDCLLAQTWGVAANVYQQPLWAHSKENNSPSLKSARTFTGVWSRMNETSERGRLFFSPWDWFLWHSRLCGSQQITSVLPEGFVGIEKRPRNANTGPRTHISWGYGLLTCMRKMFLKTNPQSYKGEFVSVTVYAWKGLLDILFS